ncbi:hypothetical protein SAMN02927916_1230 [Flavobacterium anhuiense]|uniref:Uncharacterized protein n=1 Tax=Flavobacterium anhuiense TaxID=459526 RepID=A0ABY0LG33_9FLAO|nr:AVAST type 1 anti-phage system protein Avs1c [Flavobacterium anhuiense]SCY13723.1 hypothetical protein SAMN02927916_1230 [Flavobacterium anhuiense]
MIMEKMKNIPRTRSDFERNFNILAERIRNRQQFYPSGQGQVDNLLKINVLPNKRINFLTVDEGARLHANHVASMSELKKIRF